MEFGDTNDGSKTIRTIDTTRSVDLSVSKFGNANVAELLQFHQNHAGNTNVVEWRYEMRRVMQVI